MRFVLLSIVLCVSSVGHTQTALDNHFVYFGDKVTYKQAHRRCWDYQREGRVVNWELAKIYHSSDDTLLYNHLRATVASKGSNRAWIGVSRRRVESDVQTGADQFRYEDDKPVEVAFWGPGEPNNFRKHKERCVEMRLLPKNSAGKHTWNDRPCHHLNPFFCSKVAIEQ